MAHSPLSTRAALLFALRGGAGYGLELIDRVKDLTNNRINLLQPAVYPVLRKLEEEGLSTSVEVENDAGQGGRPKRIYSLTRKGKSYVKKEQESLAKLIGR